MYAPKESEGTPTEYESIHEDTYTLKDKLGSKVAIISDHKVPCPFKRSGNVGTFPLPCPFKRYGDVGTFQKTWGRSFHGTDFNSNLLYNTDIYILFTAVIYYLNKRSVLPSNLCIQLEYIISYNNKTGL